MSSRQSGEEKSEIMAKKTEFSQNDIDIKTLNLELAKSVNLLDRHITACETYHKELNDRISLLEKSYAYFNIWDKLKTIGLIGASGAIGWMLKTILTYPK